MPLLRGENDSKQSDEFQANCIDVAIWKRQQIQDAWSRFWDKIKSDVSRSDIRKFVFSLVMLGSPVDENSFADHFTLL